eukprot:17369-Heterococcus_DN1.PRE.4
MAICSRSVALMSRLLSLRTLLRPCLHSQLQRGHAPLCSTLLGRSACSLLVDRSSKNDWLRAPQCTAKRRSSSAVAGSRQPMSESTRQILRGTAIDHLVYILRSSPDLIKGIGPKTVADLARLDITNVAGLLLHFPVSYIDRRKSCPVSEAKHGEVLTLILSVQYTVDAGYGSKAANRVVCIDKFGTEIELVYFFNYSSAGARAAWQAVKAQMPIGSTKVVSGK